MHSKAISRKPWLKIFLAFSFGARCVSCGNTVKISAGKKLRDKKCAPIVYNRLNYDSDRPETKSQLSSG